MRHAKRERTPSPSDADTTSRHLESIAASLRVLTKRNFAPSQTPVAFQALSGTGQDETISVAKRLQEHIEEKAEDLRFSSIIYADSTEAKTTAQLVA